MKQSVTEVIVHIGDTLPDGAWRVWVGARPETWWKCSCPRFLPDGILLASGRIERYCLALDPRTGKQLLAWKGQVDL